MNSKFDAILIGGGHNGLVAASYLAKAGKRTLLLEKSDHLGGATQSTYAFTGVGAKLSRYSYLVALFPDQIKRDLDLEFETLSRTVSSYTPWRDTGLLINREFDLASQKSINDFVGNSIESQNWQNFYDRIAKFAKLVAPTMLEPVPSETEVRALVGEDLWREFITQPLSQTLAENFADDVIRGIVLTDGLIGTFASATETLANICFLYHLIGNGTGEWRVPRGGMGELVAALELRARSLGVEIRTDAEVTSIKQEDDRVYVALGANEILSAKVALASCSPVTLERLSGIRAPRYRDGSQMKINMVLDRLPRLRSGIDPKLAFAGTFHINESYSQLENAYQEASAGRIPEVIPAEMYCHTLTDPSILDSASQAAGRQTLTLFALHTPATLFEFDHDKAKAEVVAKILDGLNSYLIDPIEECLARDANGELCIEVKTPQELERDIDLPRGNIFHGDLQFPWRSDGDDRKWGVETEFDRVFIAGAGALRGGGVSGIPGHNSARAALERI
jgi:phytoene dehydrogenase-like protein